MSPSNKSSRLGLGTNGGGGQPAAVQGSLLDPDYALPLFVFASIPKNTTKANPKLVNLDLPKGRIVRIWCEFPKGCNGLAGFQVWRGPRPVFPLPEDIWLYSNGSVLNFALTHFVDTNPFNLTLKFYNLDDTYTHTIWVSFEMRGVKSDLPPALVDLFQYLGDQ